jgi:hypothetical protein
LPYVGNRLFPLGERSFIFEAGNNEVHAIDLPNPSFDLENCELSTWLATGLRRSETGLLNLIPSAEYREYRKQLAEMNSR